MSCRDTQYTLANLNASIITNSKRWMSVHSLGPLTALFPYSLAYCTTCILYLIVYACLLDNGIVNGVMACSIRRRCCQSRSLPWSRLSEYALPSPFIILPFISSFRLSLHPFAFPFILLSFPPSLLSFLPSPSHQYLVNTIGVRTAFTFILSSFLSSFRLPLHPFAFPFILSPFPPSHPLSLPPFLLPFAFSLSLLIWSRRCRSTHCLNFVLHPFKRFAYTPVHSLNIY